MALAMAIDMAVNKRLDLMLDLMLCYFGAHTVFDRTHNRSIGAYTLAAGQ